MTDDGTHEPRRTPMRMALQAGAIVGPLFGVIALMATLSVSNAVLVGGVSAVVAAIAFGIAATSGRG